MLPPLWLFTDAARLADPVAAVAGLPKGLCGVVFRHDGVPGRGALLRATWRVCRARRLVMVVAGDGPVPAGVGRHLRRGRGGQAGGGPITASAHDVGELVRGFRAGAGAVFLSPVYPSASHPGGGAIGVWRWGLWVGRWRMAVFALGGIDGRSVRRLPRWMGGVGAIGGLMARL